MRLKSKNTLKHPGLFLADLSTLTVSPCATRFDCLSHGRALASSFLAVLQILSGFFLKLTVSGPPKKGGQLGALPIFLPTLSEIILCREFFPENSLLCHSPRHPKLFWPQHSQNVPMLLKNAFLV